MVVSLIALPVLLNGLGPSSFGLWSIIQAFSAVNGWISVLDFGLALGGSRWIAQAMGAEDSYRALAGAKTILRVFLGLAVILLLLTCAVAICLGVFTSAEVQVVDSSLVSLSVVVGLQAAIDIASRGPVAVLEGVQRLDLSRLSDSVRRTLMLSASCVAAMVSGDLTTTLLAATCATGLSLFLPFVLIRRIEGLKAARSDLALMKDVFHDCRGLALLRPLGVLNRTMDRFILGTFADMHAVAALEVANGLQAGASAVVSGSTDAVTTSVAFSARRKDRDAATEVVFRMTRLSLAVTSPTLLPLIIFPDVVLRVWLGTSTPDLAVQFTRVSCFALLVNALIASLSNALVGHGRSDLVTRAAAFSIVVNLLFSVGLTQGFGSVGVVYGTLGGAIILLFAVLRAGDRTLDICWSNLLFRSWIPGTLPSALVAFLLVLLKIRGFFGDGSNWPVLTGLVAIGCGLTLFISLTAQEREFVRKIIFR